MAELLAEIVSLLQSDVLACDVLVSLLWAAAVSIRHDSLVKPFPPSIPSSANGHRDISQLRTLLKSLPPLHQLLQTLEKASSSLPLSPACLQLLHWTVSPRTLSLHYMTATELEALLPQGSLQPRKPDYVFRLVYAAEQEARFQQLATPHGTFHAFHGSSVERFHSILHNGLLNMFNKTSAFGEGTYLSTHMGVSINWSPAGGLWHRSSLPPMVSCMVVCEVIKHPSIMSRQQSGGEPSLQQAIPDRYFVVTNDELVRVSHLLVFTQQRRRSSTSWLRRYWFVVCVVAYGLLLALVGMWRSRWLRQLWR
jgi:poly[ADP-ribose] polymerase 16